MANRHGQAYGLDKQLEMKRNAKFDAQLEEEIRQWICKSTGDQIPAGAHCLDSGLKDGVTLCNLINKLRPGTIKKVNKSKMPFMMMENIASYLAACRDFGVRDTDLFQTVDLFEAQNMNLVMQNLSQLARITGTPLKQVDGSSPAITVPVSVPSPTAPPSPVPQRETDSMIAVSFLLLLAAFVLFFCNFYFNRPNIGFFILFYFIFLCFCL
jgi:hypothetical protein